MKYNNKHYHVKKKEYVPHVNIKISPKENIFPTVNVVPVKKKYVEAVQ